MKPCLLEMPTIAIDLVAHQARNEKNKSGFWTAFNSSGDAARIGLDEALEGSTIERMGALHAWPAAWNRYMSPDLLTAILYAPTAPAYVRPDIHPAAAD
eukprot:scaffold70981_cov20-Prasinocladus_malaysianus.AAC.1